MTEAVEIPKEATIQTPKTQEVEKTSLDSLLIFGQGPVIDKTTREKAQSAKDGLVLEDVNLWSENLAKAASELYKRGTMRDILKDQDQNVLKEKFQIDLEDSDEIIIKKLLAITRDWPKEIGKLRGQDYSSETKRKLDEMIGERGRTDT